MLRTLATATTLLGVLLLGLVFFAQPAAAQGQTRPNIVFVMTDDQTVESLRVMTNLKLGLQAEGTTFAKTISSFPLCCPSRATQLTGQYSHNNGVTHNVEPFGGYVGLNYTNTLPAWLQSSGYRTLFLGRFLNGYGTQNTDDTEVPAGWDDWHAMVDPSTFDLSAWQMNDNGVLSNQPGATNPGEFQTDYLGRRASELIADNASSDQPFYLHLSFASPHSSRPRDPDDPAVLRTPHPAPRHQNAFAGTPLPQPPNFNEANQRDKPQVVRDRTRITSKGIGSIQENYQQELEALQSVDDALGSMLGTLRATGELDNTLFIYTSDNGFFHGEHRVRSEKVLPYEPAIRVPLVMRGPGVPRAAIQRQLVANVDLAPTILEAAGAIPGRVQDGASVFPILRDPGAQFGREVVVENGNGANRIPPYTAIRNDRFLFVRHKSTGEQELYDLRNDPFELQNLDEDDRYDRARRLLLGRLRVLEKCAGSACLATQPAVRLRLRELVPVASRRKPQPQVRPVRSCLRGGLRVVLYGAERKLVERVRYFSSAGVLGTTRRAPFRLDVKSAKLPRQGATIIRARVSTIDGRVITRDRVVQKCPRP